jgi:hypothetical protein
MRKQNRSSLFLRAAATISVTVLLFASAAYGQVAGATDVNLSQQGGYQSECAIAKNPSNKLQLFSLCNESTTGLFAARSTDGGVSWTFPDPADKTIADGNAGQGPAACCDPTLAWDTFGNLFVGYIDSARSSIVIILSTDGGVTFSNLTTFGPASVDQPTVVADAGAVWVVWNQGGQMVARGAAVTGLGVGSVGAFNALQTIPGTTNCSFGDIAIAPGGAVVNVCETLAGTGESQESLLVSVDADGLGPGNFGAAVTATTTNVGGFDKIPPQANRTVDAEVGLAFDTDAGFNGNPASPHFGRLYLVYTEEPVDESNNTEIRVRFSDNNGATWSAPIRVDDAGSTRSKFFPKIAVNRLSGNIGVCWHDARNSGTNTAMEEFCSIAPTAGATPTFMANARISDGASTSSTNPNQFGDYSGLAYFQGLEHPIWGDTSNSTGNNPDGTAEFDAYTDRVTGGAAAMEGDPHITTVDGIAYDFQGGGEYVSLRDGDGLEIQTRQTPVGTGFRPGANPYTGLATCVSLNTAIAARVGSHRVTYQPNLSGVPDPSGLQLRIDGDLRTLGGSGVDLGDDGRVVSTGGGGIRIDFPNETILTVTPGWWPSQSKWYLNVDVLRTPSFEGLMGALPPGNWLPALADGTALGAKPANLHQRYVDVYQKFGESWRVTNRSSLFDYARGTSTATFTVKTWPPEDGPCVIPDQPPVHQVTAQVAESACRRVVNKGMHTNCVFDVRFTGNTGFAETYLSSQQAKMGSTTTVLTDNDDPTQVGETAVFEATVSVNGRGRKHVPSGTVQFVIDGANAGAPIKLDDKGKAAWDTSRLRAGKHRVTAYYVPTAGSVFVASTSGEESHTVKRCFCESAKEK